MSLRYRPVPHTAVFGEFASYTWGPTKTSAELIGLSDIRPVKKNGFYVGGDASIPLAGEVRLGATITREQLGRDDALIKYLSLQNLYNVQMGEKERSTVFRFYLDLGPRVLAGAYFVRLDNPFPWVSGIVPATGPRAFQGRGNNKWGLVSRLSLK